MYTPISQMTVARRYQPQDLFDANIDEYMRLLPSNIDQINLAGLQTDQNAMAAAVSAAMATLAASDAASSALAAAASANATKWVSGHTYADGDVAWSLLDTFPYRRIGAGAGTVDPKLDGVNWTLQMYGLGLGGVQITGNITLTATSPAMIKVVPAGPGLYATGPAGTTCQKSALQFGIDNTQGEYDYGFKDGAGNVLGWVKPGTTSMLGIVDTSTTAGVWTMTNISKVGITAAFDAPAWVFGNNVQRVAIDANRTALLVTVNPDGQYVVVYDASSQSWGTPVLIRSAGGASQARMVLSASNQLMVLSSVGTALQAATLTVAGVGLTPNAPYPVTTSSAIADIGELKAVGSSWVLAYVLTTSAALGARAISVSGTAPTIGAESALSGSTTAPSIFATGSVARIVSANTSAIYCQPFTVSGSTLSIGTVASATATASSYRAFQTGSGNILAFYNNTTQYGVLFKLTSTTEAASAVNLNSATTDPFGSLDYVEVSSTKTSYVTSAGVGGSYTGIITDTSGTISTGTVVAFGATYSTIAGLGVIGSTARFALSSSVSKSAQLRLDCSGTTPAVLASPVSYVDVGDIQPRARSGARHWSMLTAGTTAYGMQGGNASQPIAVYTPNRIRRAPELDLLPQAGAAGAANEAWIMSETDFGVSIRRVEVAA